MNGVNEVDLSNALDILSVSRKELDQVQDFKKLEQGIKKKWHPDNAIRLGLSQYDIDRHTRIFQKIPTCIEVFERYLNQGIKKLKKEETTEEKDTQKNSDQNWEPLFKNLQRLRRNGKHAKADSVAAVALINAALKKDKKLVVRLLKSGVEIDGFYSQASPLSWVVKENDLEMAAFLLQLGASPNTEMDRRGVLFNAIEQKNYPMAELLLKAGADPERILNNEISSLGVYHRKGAGWTLLMQFIDSAELSIIELLVKYGADINTFTGNGPVAGQGSGWTPLMIAVQYERFEIVEFLLRKGAKVHFATQKGLTAKRLANQSGNVYMIELIQKYST
ncbi:MAG: ankyrin repeat domain-containing protein [Proteobacteria bacterium]|nr:ankyrin repeat domain-containing protein [Pseudomonadota bacterium]